MTDTLVWLSGVVILVIFAAVIWFNRLRMRAEVARMRGANPDFQALAAELRRSNDLLDKIAGEHERRLQALERGTGADGEGPGRGPRPRRGETAGS